MRNKKDIISSSKYALVTKMDVKFGLLEVLAPRWNSEVPHFKKFGDYASQLKHFILKIWWWEVITKGLRSLALAVTYVFPTGYSHNQQQCKCHINAYKIAESMVTLCAPYNCITMVLETESKMKIKSYLEAHEQIYVRTKTKWSSWSEWMAESQLTAALSANTLRTNMTNDNSLITKWTSLLQQWDCPQTVLQQRKC